MTAIAYLMGVDDPKDGNRFYTEAKGFFDAKRIKVVAPPTADGLTLADVFADLVKRAATSPPAIFDRIHIVTHATMFGGVQFGLDAPRRLFYGLPFLDADLLRRAHAEATKPSSDWLKPLASPAVTSATTIQIDGCDIGRDLDFLKLFGQMFGTPRCVLASRRVLQFFHLDGAHRSMPCRTWSVVLNSPPYPPKKPAEWTALRAAFVSSAAVKFMNKASERDPLGFVTFEDAIKAKVANATADSARSTYFLAEGIDITWDFDVKPADDTGALRRLLPTTRSKADAGAEVDDTTVVTVVGPGNFVITGTDLPPAGRRIAASVTVVMLAERMGVDADASNRDHYAEVLIAPAKQPSPGPTPPAGGPPPGRPATPPPASSSSSSPHAGLLESIRTELAGDGAATAALDALVADLARPEPAPLLPEPEAGTLPVAGTDDLPGVVV